METVAEQATQNWWRREIFMNPGPFGERPMRDERAAR